MKKVLVAFITFTLLFNFIFCYHTYADEDPLSIDRFGDGAVKYLVEDTAQLAENDITDMLDSGQSGKTSSNQYDILEDKGLLGTVVGLFGFMLSVLPLMGEVILTVLGGNLGSENITGYFTIQKVVFNQIGLFYCDFFDFNSEYEAAGATVLVPDCIVNAKVHIAKMFYVLRYLSTALSLLVLIYIGIRMAISTVASEQAKYKRMFVSWIESIVILYMVQYIISIMFFISKLLMNGCWEIYNSMNNAGATNFEEELITSIFSGYKTISGVGVIYLTLSLWVLAYAHLKFFWIYMKRFLMTGFLITLSPLITITYPIDKAEDGKAQAFQAWFRELSITAFIQPLHCVIYMVFNETAGEISKVAPLLALIFLVLITYVEKVVRKIIFSADKGLVVGAVDDVTKGIKGSFDPGGLVKKHLGAKKSP